MAWSVAVTLLAARALYRGVVTPPATIAITPCRVDVNRASAAELQVLPGVGPSRAEALVLSRLRDGPFRALQDLDRVDGFGDDLLRRLRPHVRFGVGRRAGG
ncbi:MAG: ComEA family DNA-binding protein [Planctomycetota bacterium]